ncbi:MAG: aminodeoxychorismate/anthranilate synthase component II [Bacteroidetes bacterium]|nr:aminodeoxychorismate/anthranilate synthase component II [Bacteroidota bacterium]
MLKVLLYDSYDSFTYNLKDYLEQEGAVVKVVCNDELSLEEIIKIKPNGLVISPGPRHPEASGNLMEVLNHFYDKIPVLGVCLGHQAIGIKFGFRLVRNGYPMHGKVSDILRREDQLFKEIPEKFQVCRYHSLVLAGESPEELQILATASDGSIMAIRHKEFPVWGVQYHPEAILTEYGHELMRNWFEVVKNHALQHAEKVYSNHSGG